MPAAPPPSRDVALETRFFWERYKKPILILLVVALVGALGFAGYRFYQDRRTASASALLAAAKNAHDYEQVIAGYSGTPAAADACLLLAEAQRKEGKFA